MIERKIKYRANEQHNDKVKVSVHHLIRLSASRRVSLELQVPTSSEEEKLVTRYRNSLLNDITYLMRKRDTIGL